MLANFKNERERRIYQWSHYAWEWGSYVMNVALHYAVWVLPIAGHLIVSDLHMPHLYNWLDIYAVTTWLNSTEEFYSLKISKHPHVSY